MSWSPPEARASRRTHSDPEPAHCFESEDLTGHFSGENPFGFQEVWERDMDRGEGIVRWSPNAARDEFVTINVTYRILERHRAIGNAVPELFEYQSLSKHSDVPALTAFDWSPRVGGLLAAGTKGGDVHLMRVDDDSNDSIVLPLKLQRACQAVAFNSTGLLAVGLDRVRNDQCLQVWDINQRLSKWDPAQRGWQSTSTVFEPIHKLEPSVAISSVKFFPDQPQTLVVGVKNQSVRIHDLRDPHSAVVTFQTRCNNNLGIDHADSNYFASSALEGPTIMIWDRRASTRQSCSKMYLESIDAQEVPFGCALKVNKAIDTQQNAYVRSLRYCRDKRGHLGVLSSAGELQVLCTAKEYVEPIPENDVEGTPELLEVKRSHPIRYPFYDESFGYHIDDRVVSFDWMTLGSPEFQPRVVTRNCKQALEVKLMPSTAQHLAFDFINFSGRARFNEYFEFPKFDDPKETDFALGDIATIDARRNASFRAANMESSITGNTSSSLGATEPSTTLDTRQYAKNTFGWIRNFDENLNSVLEEVLATDLGKLSLAPQKPISSRERHEFAHWTALQDAPDAEIVYNKLSKTFRSRALQGYLFNCEKNQEIMVGDPWLEDVWVWIEGAEQAALEDRMVSDQLDLKYMGVHTIWNDDLGNKFQSRLIGTETRPTSTEWELAIEKINKRNMRPKFEGLKTLKPHHRQLCLAICGWGKPTIELDADLKELEERGQFSKAAVWALCEQESRKAVQILQRHHDEAPFAGLALAIYSGGASGVLDSFDLDNTLEKSTQLRRDPYLRAIYALLGTGDWKAIADETSLPLRDRVGIALRNFDDAQLTSWLDAQMTEAITTGDIEGIVLSGITDNMVDILSAYVPKFGDYQTATLIMSFAHPLYISDYRAAQWRSDYRNYLNAIKQYILRCRFDVQSTRKSVTRDGISIIKPKPRQVTLRCVHCDTNLTNDADNTANPPLQGGTSHPSGIGGGSSLAAERNPLYPSGVHAGIQCPKCGRHLPRCAICLQHLGMPRSDRPELRTEEKAPMAEFLSFCMKCDHGFHAEHARMWFERHDECPVTSCRCKCNQRDIVARQLFGPGDEKVVEEKNGKDLDEKANTDADGF